MEQRSDEWFHARLGMITASRFKDVLAKTKSGPSTVRTNYLYQIVAERLTHEPQDNYQNTAMRWGIEKEDAARAAFEWAMDVEVETVGFVRMDESIGASPDGLIGADCGLEIKCPYSTAVHLKTFDRGDMPAEHKAQVQGCMMVTGRDWWHFVSFDPRLPERIRLFSRIVGRDSDYIAMLTEAINKFDKEAETLIEKLMQ